MNFVKTVKSELIKSEFDGADNLTKHTAAGRNKKNHSGRLQRLGHDLLQLSIVIAMTGSEQIHCCNRSQKKCHEGLSEEGKNRLNASQGRDNLCHRM